MARLMPGIAGGRHDGVTVYNGTAAMSYFRPTVDALRAYEPGEQPPPEADIVKLNTNENPYPPSPQALAALREIDHERLRRYPDPFASEFRLSAAEVLGIEPDTILVGNGSDDILTMLIRSVADGARAVAYPVPTYALYRTLAEIQGAPVAEVRSDETYALPLDTLAATGAPLTLVASPNSPSGRRVSNDLIRDLASRVDGILAIDEAYVDFATGDALELAQSCDNVVVIRTLSKSHSLAGLRLGFAVASPAVIAGLAKVKDSYNVDAVAARVGAAAYRDVVYTRDAVARICASREGLTNNLSALGFHVWPSEANFVLVRPANGNARDVYEGLKSRGILVRYFDVRGLDDKLRITVGTESQNDRLVATLKSLASL